MYQLGHYGAALAMFAPVGALLIGTGQTTPAIIGWMSAVAVSTLPDLDSRVPLFEHRGITHTVWFVILCSGIIGIGVAVVFPAMYLYVTLGVFVGLTSHLLADVLTPMGIRPFGPIYAQKYTLRLTKARNTIANYVILAFGIIVSIAAIYIGSVV